MRRSPETGFARKSLQEMRRTARPRLADRTARWWSVQAAAARTGEREPVLSSRPVSALRDVERRSDATVLHGSRTRCSQRTSTPGIRPRKRPLDATFEESTIQDPSERAWIRARSSRERSEDRSRPSRERTSRGTSPATGAPSGGSEERSFRTTRLQNGHEDTELPQEHRSPSLQARETAPSSPTATTAGCSSRRAERTVEPLRPYPAT